MGTSSTRSPHDEDLPEEVSCCILCKVRYKIQTKIKPKFAISLARMQRIAGRAGESPIEMRDEVFRYSLLFAVVPEDHDHAEPLVLSK